MSKQPTKKFRKFEFLSFNDGAEAKANYRDVLDYILSGAASADEVVQMCALFGQIKEGDKYVMLDDREYALVLRKTNAYQWNFQKANRLAEGEFIEYVRNLPIIDAEVVASQPKK